MLALSSTRTAMYEHLRTNAVSWKAATVGEGVTKRTVLKMIKCFFEILHRQAASGFKGDESTFGYLAKDFHNVYVASMGREPHYEQYIVEVAD
jgi:hypothetical protein